MTKEQLHTLTTTGKTRLDEVTSTLNTAVVDSPLKDLIGVDDIEAAWESLTLARLRLIVDTLVTVRFLPVGQRGRGFDPATVGIRFKKQLQAERPARLTVAGVDRTRPRSSGSRAD